ncbi:nuclease-related domain-containing protein [Lysobacter korlensis]|uniref:Nuclease-related domain-containing protein n=1 Tax=Lysobacter korlensis TaxID=553636 RepID=A0ABV6RYZ2_9GAMM
MSTTVREHTTPEQQSTEPVATPARGTATRADATALHAGRGTTYGMVRECLRVQAFARPRTRFSRFLGMSPLHPEARNAYEAALDELAVREELQKLGSEWTVLSGVPIGAHDDDVDHIVLGPGGIFSISVKHAADATVWVGGRSAVVGDQPVDFVRRAQSEGASAARSLSNAAGGPVQITPLLVVSRPASLTLRDPGVAVVAAKGLATWLRRQRRVHSPEAVAYYAMVAAEPDTWNLEPALVEDTLRDLQRFDHLRHDVEAAAVRRRALRVASGAGLLAALAGGRTAASSHLRALRPAGARAPR